jgi:hypothetical protein
MRGLVRLLERNHSPVRWLLVLSLVAACARPNYAETRPGWLLISAGPQPGYAIKLVIEKQAPITLVGDDGSICRTSRERFARTREGKWIACVWHLPVLDSTESANLTLLK